MSDLIDSELLMPIMAWPRLERLLKTMGTYIDEYSDTKNFEITRGLELEPIPPTELGSKTKLIENSSDETTPEGGSGYETYYQQTPEQAFQRELEGIGSAYDYLWEISFPSTPIEHGEDSWRAIVIASFIDKDKRFLLGIAQRELFQFVQYRIAKVLLNVFCLDNRGRPR